MFAGPGRNREKDRIGVKDGIKFQNKLLKVGIRKLNFPRKVGSKKSHKYFEQWRKI
jgi:hypothetical protein